MSDINAIKHELSTMANGDNADFASAAQYLLQVVAAVEQGQMSVSEAAEMMRDMQRQIAVIQNAEHLANKERLNTIINGLITLAGAV
jgi:polyhydroxyalkanoate synthesis regulator phasin